MIKENDRFLGGEAVMVAAITNVKSNLAKHLLVVSAEPKPGEVRFQLMNAEADHVGAPMPMP